MKEFGATIRELREKKGLLLRQVAAELDIDTALLSKVERGERFIKKDQVKRIAEIIGTEEKGLLVLWLSAKINSVIKNEDFPLEALKLSLKKSKKERLQ
ncbi:MULTISPECIES: helix-turn-helix domain-containing protein [Chitinophaga]|uniref:helix-turn-helix domain-containing protein n=1 Tax=Chitinophaga TaxID=79328 RepID=UPI001CEC6F86|nr:MULTISPECIES: helix-turn-helix transcriptional regulator [Chitinophaga]